jgi:hypothetical protein
MSRSLNPIPSWLRASAWDAGNMNMWKADGRFRHNSNFAAVMAEIDAVFQ